MTGETILTNARIVLADEVIDGSLLMRNGKIADIAPGATRKDSPSSLRSALHAASSSSSYNDAEPSRSACTETSMPCLARV